MSAVRFERRVDDEVFMTMRTELAKAWGILSAMVDFPAAVTPANLREALSHCAKAQGIAGAARLEILTEGAAQ